jgi:UDP-N-acetylmuramate dehydrogenase
MQLEENVPLAPLTTFKVGGPARYFAEIRTADEAVQAVEFAREKQLPLFILGGGSNLVVSDRGFHGLVAHIAIAGIDDEPSSGKRLFRIGAGEDWDRFVAHTVKIGCAGIENLSGIPGTVGGTPVQNVGAYGQEVAETIQTVRTLDVTSLREVELSNQDSGFSYRTSIFNSAARGRYIVLQVTFALTPGGEPTLKYADLQKFFGQKPDPSLQEVRDAVRQIRLGKAMLIVPGDDDCRSAGSFFKNPIVSEQKYEEIASIAERSGKRLPSYPAPEGNKKISAAWLVEQSGFVKGYDRGLVGISRRHSLAIVNRGGARAADIIALKDEVQRGVREKFGLELHPEPVFVGFD